MEQRWGKIWGVVVLAAVAAALLAGCGSSSSSSSSSSASKSSSSTSSSASDPQRAQLLAKLPAQLQGSGDLNAPDLAACIEQQAHSLSTAELTKLANAGANPDAATKAIVARLTSTCIAQGHGTAAVRRLMSSSITSQLDPTLPPAYRDCVLAKADQIPASQLAQLLSVAEQSQARGTAAGRAIGVSLGKQCLGDPGVVRALKAKVLQPIKQAFGSSSQYSAAFRNCLIGKAEKISAAQIREFALHPDKANAIGDALGRKWAQQCVASGATP
jgi:hypothetical protein